MIRLPFSISRQSLYIGSILFLMCVLAITVLGYMYIQKNTTETTSSTSNEPTVVSTTEENATPLPYLDSVPATSTVSSTTDTSTDTSQTEKPSDKKPSPTVTTTPKTKKAPTPDVPSPPVPQPLTEATVTLFQEPTIDSAKLLSGHNAIRREKGLAPLTWSPSLALGAQAWSDVLKNEGCVMRHNYTSGFGENIYWQKQNGGNVLHMISSEALANDAWISEEKYFSYDDNTCKSGKQCGHYTQIVWADTKEVGCGVSSCHTNDSRTDIWVCRYSPQGNIIGQKPY